MEPTAPEVGVMDFGLSQGGDRFVQGFLCFVHNRLAYSLIEYKKFLFL